MKWPPDITPLPSPVGDETWERFRQVSLDLAIERGYYGFEASDIVERAGASRVEFDARFTGKRDCCDRTYEANIAEFDQALVDPYLRAPSWREGIRAGAYGAAEYLRHHRRERRYGELRMREGGPMEQAKKDHYLQRVVDLIDVGRCEMSDPDALGRSTAEGVVGSIYGLLLKRLGSPGKAD
jgi:AcrR family transcriptional regulator